MGVSKSTRAKRSQIKGTRRNKAAVKAPVKKNGLKTTIKKTARKKTTVSPVQKKAVAKKKNGNGSANNPLNKSDKEGGPLKWLFPLMESAYSRLGPKEAAPGVSLINAGRPAAAGRPGVASIAST